jgi:hypothetical protein
MKNFFKIIIVLFTVVSSAQVQTITPQLKLATVNEGTASDSVLVRGSNGVVKYVKKSDLLESVSGTPTLQQVTTSGNITTNTIFAPFFQTGTNPAGAYALLTDTGFLQLKSNTSGVGVGIGRITPSLLSGITKTFNLPDKSGTFALLEDTAPQGLQSVLSVSNTATTPILIGNGSSNLAQIYPSTVSVSDASSNSSQMAAGYVGSYAANGNYAVLNAGGNLEFKTNTGGSKRSVIIPNSGVPSGSFQTFTLPATSGTLAKLTDIPSVTTPSLQQVTNSGNVTSNNINIQTGLGGLLVGGGSVNKFGFEWDNSSSFGKIGTRGSFDWPILFQQNDVTKMIITDTGNVGVGTESPSAKLDINGLTNAGLGVVSNWSNGNAGFGTSYGGEPEVRDFRFNSTGNSSVGDGQSVSISANPEEFINLNALSGSGSSTLSLSPEDVIVNAPEFLYNGAQVATTDLTIPITGTSPGTVITGDLKMPFNSDLGITYEDATKRFGFTIGDVPYIKNADIGGENSFFALNILGAYVQGTSPEFNGITGENDYSDNYNPNTYIQKTYSDKQHSYYTTETNTQGKWINNKPIYRKVLVFSGANLPVDGGFTTSISTIDEIIDVKVLTDATTDVGLKTWGTHLVSYGIDYEFEVDSGALLFTARDFFGAPTDMTGYDKVTLVIEYTKTTD